MLSSSKSGKVDNLIAYAEEEDIPVYFGSLPLTKSLSLCRGGNCYIAIDPDYVESSADGNVKIAHELGHCKTGSFYTRYSRADVFEKHEYRADKWAVHRLLPVQELQAAIREGYTELWQLAEHFNVTEKFLRRALYLYTCEGVNFTCEETEASDCCTSPPSPSDMGETHAAPGQAGVQDRCAQPAVSPETQAAITTVGQLLRFMVDNEVRKKEYVSPQSAEGHACIDIYAEK